MKGIGVVFLALALPLTLVLLPAVSAQPNKPLTCGVMIEIDASSIDPYWYGPVTGDIKGYVEFHEQWEKNYVVGKTEHFFEEFTITTEGGDIIKGFDEGVWNFATFKFRANGWVTEASGEWSYLVGYKFHEIGTTTPLAPVIDGWGTMTLVHG